MNHQDRRAGSLFQNDLRREDYGPRFYAYYYKQWSNYRMSYHEHDSTEIMYIISGTCRVDVQMENGIVEQAVLKKGQFILLDAGVPHRLLVEDGVPCRMLNVEFGFTKVSPDKPSIRQLALEEEEVAELLNSAAPYLVLSDPEEVYHILKSLVLELDQRGLIAEARFRSATSSEGSDEPSLLSDRVPSPFASPYSDAMLTSKPADAVPVIPRVLDQGERARPREARNLQLPEQGTLVRTLFIQLLVRVARLYIEQSRSTLDQTESYVKRCVEFMHQNMDRSIQMKDIASAVNLHPGYLHRIFRKHTGLTPTNYLTTLRMEKAKMLLQQTDIQVSDISDYVGVGSRQYFHMLFKKYTGLAPVEYRSSMGRQVSQYPE
ncbi:AraC family transcriptional regulator [Paenibacillus massiliensis]|uniref:AraC family transcriptional regulator n=1 Tax=Paenibacillus massiliensis TaxID=225917 RepID=UPI00036BACB2|nr:AraC family transcriptional regulator [Paenibacillus massiliensis]